MKEEIRVVAKKIEEIVLNVEGIPEGCVAVLVAHRGGNLFCAPLGNKFVELVFYDTNPLHRDVVFVPKYLINTGRVIIDAQYATDSQGNQNLVAEYKLEKPTS